MDEYWKQRANVLVSALRQELPGHEPLEVLTTPGAQDIIGSYIPDHYSGTREDKIALSAAVGLLKRGEPVGDYVPVAGMVRVELRMWRADDETYGTRLTPVSIPAKIVSDRMPEPVLEVANGNGEMIPYTAAEFQAEAPGMSMLVRKTPTNSQVRLLEIAAEFGFPVEPRVAGESWRELEEL